MAAGKKPESFISKALKNSTKSDKPSATPDLAKAKKKQANAKNKGKTPLLRDSEKLFETALDRLKKSKFRASFHLSRILREYAEEKGPARLQEHAAAFIQERLAPAFIPNDGKQTPLKGHPVFIAQHACACCCRGCLYKWYHIPKNRELSAKEQKQIIALLLKWMRQEMQKDLPPSLNRQIKATKNKAKSSPENLDLFR
ncbi:DUF4186 domain-containing protein [Acetobacteraceae bacterium]|nr:DUF4186 domain-containing protein [Acetobacteraceae bacterium]